MSGFDDNPFADPFAEPSIRQATQPATNNAGLDEYDPFSAGATTTPSTNNTTTPANSAPMGQLINEPAVMAPSTTVGMGGNQAPPPYTQSAQQQVTTAEFQELKRRQEELEKKAQELARKEEELKNASLGGARQNNWPPLPQAFPVGPCFYQDINVDIPLEFQKIVRMLYYLWMFHVIMLLLNVLGGLAILVRMGSNGATFGLALLYFFLFTPFSYVCWFRPVYKAFRNDSSFNFMVFFFVFFFQMLVSIADAIGIPSMGACGWVAVGEAFSNHYIGLGCFLVLIAVCNSALAAAMAFMLLWVHRIYRSTGASFAKAQMEFTQGVMRNEHVQSAAAEAVSQAARSQFTNAQSPEGTNNTTGPRF